MRVAPLAIPEVKLIEPKRFEDARGFFSEVYNARDLAGQGVEIAFVQDNHALSVPAGVLRGLHFQVPPFDQDKLVRVPHGRVLDVAVDIRCGSPTYGQHVAVELSAAAWNQLLIPRGFAHGYLSLEPNTEVLYKVSAHYAPEHDAGLVWNDPDLAIDWPTHLGDPILSDKDRNLPRLADLPTYFTYAPNGEDQPA